MVADDLKRVGLIFDAQGALDFKASLKSVNAALSDNRAEFKLTKAAWDDNTKASEKLKATNQFLAKQYEDTATKVNVLTKELKSLEGAEERDEKAIKKKKAELHNAKAAMINYKKGLEETSAKLKAGTADLEEYAKGLQKTGDKAKRVGGELSKYVTVPIVGIGAASIKTGADFDKSMAQVAATMGKTVNEIDDLRQTAIKMGSETAFSASEAAEGLNYLALAGYDSNQQMAALPKTLTLAAAGNMELGDASDMLTDSMSALGLASKDTNILMRNMDMMVDQMAATSSKSNTSVAQLGESILAIGGTAKSLSGGTAELNTTLGLLADNGIKGAESGKHLRNIILAMNPTTDAAASAWERLGVKAYDAQGNLRPMKEIFGDLSVALADYSEEEKTAMLQAMFNKTDLASINALLSTSAERWNELGDAVENSAGAGGKMADTQLDNLSGDVTLLKSAMEGAAIKISDAFAPVLREIVQCITNLIDKFNNLSPSMQRIIVIVGGVAAAVGPLILLFGTLASSVSKIILMYTNFKAATAGVAGSTSLLAKAMAALSPPIMAIIALVTAVVAALVQLWNTNEGFRNSVQSAIESISSVLTNIWETIIQPIFTRIQEIIMNVWENGLKPLWDKWVEFVGDITVQMAALLEQIMPVVDWFVETFGPMLVFVFDLVGSVFGDTVTTILQVAGALLSNIGDVVSNIIGVFSGIIDFISNVFTGNWQGAWDSIVSIFGNIFDGLINVAKIPINIIIGFINGMVGGVESGVNAVIRAMNSLSFDIPDWIPLIGGQHWGFDLGLVSFGRIPYLAKGGQLLSGMAMVAEAGPELLLQQGNRTTVAPLTNGGGATPVDIIDYDKMALAMVQAFKGMAVKIWDEKIGEIMDERIIKAVA